MINSEPSTLITGEKLNKLESSRDIHAFCEFLIDSIDKSSSKVIPLLSDGEKEGFAQIVEALIAKSEDSSHEISGAAYSSILVYTKNSKLKIHAGANIDPHIEHFGDPHHRNCAEKQASLSAREERLGNEHLDLMFLYRQPQLDREHSPEMLVPCSDCASNYLKDLQEHNGKLIIILPDNEEREFLIDNPANGDHSVNVLDLGDISDSHQMRKIYYRVIYANELPYLKVEKELGSKILDNGKDSESNTITLSDL